MKVMTLVRVVEKGGDVKIDMRCYELFERLHS